MCLREAGSLGRFSSQVSLCWVDLGGVLLQVTGTAVQAPLCPSAV